MLFNYCHCFFNFREITFEAFEELLHTIAPKYAKDNKLGSNEIAFKAMVDSIAQGGPSLAGTTVR